MLAMMAVIVDYMFKNVFLTFYTLQVGPLKRHRARGNFSSNLPLFGPGCINNALINVSQCSSALKINALTALLFLFFAEAKKLVLLSWYLWHVLMMGDICWHCYVVLMPPVAAGALLLMLFYYVLIHVVVFVISLMHFYPMFAILAQSIGR